MWTNLRTFSSMLTLSLIYYVIFQTVQADDLDLLRNIFADAVANDVTSLETMATALKPEWAETLKISSWTSACLNSTNDFDALKSCLQTRSKCMSLKDVSSLFNFTASQSLSSHHVSSSAPALLYSLLSCSDENLEALAVAIEKKGRPASEASWGYSFLFVTLINLASLTGAIVLPCMRFKSYKLVLMFMVALAVGTLAGSGLLFLIPEAFLLVHDDHDMSYIWKSTTIMGGIYLFYVTEKIMRMINARKENTSLKKQRDEMATKGTITTSFRRIPVDNSIPQKDPSHIPEDIGGMCNTHTHSNTSSRSSSSEVANSYEQRNEGDKGNVEMDIDVIAISGGGGGDMLLPTSPHEKTVSNGSGNKYSHHHHHHHHHQASEVAPVAYMIIFGDALHNFIDGLSIGSAFTQSIMTGVSVSVAVLCEELPHELGDFAILLNSGMRFKKAIMYNFLSACTCYIGTVIGILLGENTSSHEWIFAVAGGMFLYISLVDMMPEMNSAAESEEGRQFGEIKTMILQNAGLLTGFGIMLTFAVFGGNIKFD